MPTIGDLIQRNATWRPRSEALVEGGRAWTWAEVETHTARLANGLAELGAGPGDRVGVVAPCSADTALAMLAVHRAGAAVVPFSTRLSAAQLEAGLDLSRPRLVLVPEPARPDPFAEVGVPWRRPASLLGAATARAAEFPPESPSTVFLTSGTTGRPKPVVLTHASQLANSVNCALGRGYSELDRMLVYGSLAYVAGLGSVILPMLLLGGTIVVSGSTGLEEVAAEIERRRVTALMAFQPTLVDLSEAGGRLDRQLASLARVLTATPWGLKEPRLAAMIESLDRIGASWIWMYGQTEAGSAISTLLPGGLAVEERVRLGLADCVGRPCPNVEVDIDAPDGEVGEILVRSDAVMSGYLDRPDLTAAAFTDGRLRTGDLGRRESDGRFFFVARERDLIKTGGLFVAPMEVEQALAAHPAVREAAVVGSPHERWGEAVVAFVVPAGEAPDPAQLTEHLRDRLPRHAVPKLIVVRERLPKIHGNDEKLDRASLRAELRSRPPELLD
jgi:acyl-CoA synthetase (AMP-forming)/AMP-acid ligase II